MPRWSTFGSFLADVAQAAGDAERQALVAELLSEHTHFPWIEDTQATFVYTQPAERVALNLDTIPNDPPFEPFQRIDGTDFWYLTYPFERDDLLDYLIAVDDPMTPLVEEIDLVGRVGRYWRADPLNPQRIETGGTSVSVLRMGEARPFPNWAAFQAVARGRITDHFIDSDTMNYQQRHLWVYTPPGYATSGLAYPLLILQDGQWAVGPLQVPQIADALIKHKRIPPMVIAMIQSGSQEERSREYIANDRYYQFLLSELLPLVQTNYRIDSQRIGVGGVAVGAVAALRAALSNPAVFSRLIMISPPLGKGAFQDELRVLRQRLVEADRLPARIYHSVGRYEARARFIKPAEQVRSLLENDARTAYRFVMPGSGHGLVAFRALLPEALTWAFPGEAFGGR